MNEIELLKRLKDPFDPSLIKWRVGATTGDKKKGIALAYLDAREVKKRLDEVCGVMGWQNKLIPVEGGFISELSICLDGQWVTKSNAADNTKISALKGGASDAFKRAASTWGIGHYLYYLPVMWVELKPKGRSHELASSPKLPDWAKPGSLDNREDEDIEMVGEDIDDYNQESSLEDNLNQAIENM